MRRRAPPPPSFSLRQPLAAVSRIGCQLQPGPCTGHRRPSRAGPGGAPGAPGPRIPPGQAARGVNSAGGSAAPPKRGTPGLRQAPGGRRESRGRGGRLFPPQGGKCRSKERSAPPRRQTPPGGPGPPQGEGTFPARRRAAEEHTAPGGPVGGGWRLEWRAELCRHSLFASKPVAKQGPGGIRRRAQASRPPGCARFFASWRLPVTSAASLPCRRRSCTGSGHTRWFPASGTPP